MYITNFLDFRKEFILCLFLLINIGFLDLIFNYKNKNINLYLFFYVYLIIIFLYCSIVIINKIELYYYLQQLIHTMDELQISMDTIIKKSNILELKKSNNFNIMAYYALFI